MIERLPSQSRKAFNYEAQIAKIEEEIERYQKLKLGLYENFIGGVIDKSEYFEFRNSYTKIIHKYKERDDISDAMFREMVDKIIVHEAEGTGGARTQQVDFCFNYAGEVHIAYTEEELAQIKRQYEISQN